MVKEDRERSVWTETIYGYTDPMSGSHRSSGSVLPKSFRSRKPFGFQKITTDPHILDHVNIDSPYDRYTKLKIYMRIDFR